MFREGRRKEWEGEEGGEGEEVDRCSLSWGSGRGLLEVYQGWTDAASGGDLEEVY